MVRIVNFKQRLSEDGESFFVLELQSGIELVKSKSTNNIYATARKTSITSTFDEATCKSLIGTELHGKIEKQECEPYEYVIEDTGEVIKLSHRYQYVPEEDTDKAQIDEMSNSTIEDFVDINKQEPIFEVEAE